MNILKTVAISALLLGAPPVAFDLLPLDAADTGAAVAKGNGNGNKGGGNRGGGSRRNENAGRPDTAGSGRPTTNGGAARRVERENAPVVRPTNVHARLKGLNSLNRNINGLMNSSDPKMDLFREFVTASADYETALETLGDAFTDFDADGSYQAMLDGLNMTVPTNAAELDAMIEQLTALSTADAPIEADSVDAQAYQDALIAWQSSMLAASQALSIYEGSDLYAAANDAGATGEASSEDAMIEAMVAGLNATGAGPVTVGDMSPEMIEWVASQLGVGESDGLIDAYLAQMEETMVPEEVAETDG